MFQGRENKQNGFDFTFIPSQHAHYKTPFGLKGEVPSCANVFSARGGAKLAAFMANKGTLNGEVLLSEAGWEQLHAEPIMAPMWIYTAFIYTNFSQGGINLYGLDCYYKA